MDNKDMPATGWPETEDYFGTDGLTKLEYACIHLGVPKTGDPDLDEVIREGERRRVAAMAMQATLSSGAPWFPTEKESHQCSTASQGYADALLTALDREADSERD